MDNSLVVESLSYWQGKRHLIDGISFTLLPGEMVALIGPNGAGKSTLLRLLTGYSCPSAGQILLNGKPLAEWPVTALARQRAVMRQQAALPHGWPVEDVVAMGRAPWQGHQPDPVVNSVMALAGCEGLQGRRYHQLSGGEQQRVQLARALAQLWHEDGPKGWLFLDEPTSALDLHHQQQVLSLLKRLVQPGQLHVCVVLHDLNLASLWADRIMLMHQGVLVASGPPASVLDAPTLSHWYQADLVVHPHPECTVPQVLLRR